MPRADHRVRMKRVAREAVGLLESLPPGRELAMAYGRLAQTCAVAERTEEATAWANRELELAQRLGDTEITAHALGTLGTCQFTDGGLEKLKRSLESAQRSGLAEQAGLSFVWLGGTAVEWRRHAVADHYLEAGTAYCSDRGLELFRYYLLAYRARLELDRGCWSQAADWARSVVRIPRTSTTPRIIALVVLGLVRARRGDPGQWALLDEAWALAEPTGELRRLGPVAAARAEAAWLKGTAMVESATEAALPLALERKSGWLIGELVGGVGAPGSAGMSLRVSRDRTRCNSPGNGPGSELDQDRLPLRGCACARGRGRGGAVTARARGAAAPRGTPSGGDCRAPPA